MLMNKPPMPHAISTAWNTVARFDDVQTAQRPVDRSSAGGFAVDKLDIPGSDRRLVERMPGWLTKAQAAGAAAVTGMWEGLLIGILFGLFTTGHFWLGAAAAGAGFGALWGAVFGFAAHAAGGQRDVSSVRGLSDVRYDLIAHHGSAERARTILGQAGLPPAAP